MSGPPPRSRSGEPHGRATVTALVPTHNEESNLEECLASVAWCDELLVVDSFSTDRTREIAARRGARVLVHEYINSAAQKNWSIPQACHPWVLVVDADERVTRELRDEILAVLARPDASDAYSIPRVNHFLGRRIRHGGWEADRVIRLFRRDRARYQDKQVHSEIEVPGSVARLSAPLLHFTFRSFEQYLPKLHRYTDWGASQAFREGRRAGFAALLLRPPLRFLKMYFLRRGFLDGTHGLVLAGLAAFSVYLKYSKLWEMARREPEPGASVAGKEEAAGAPEAREG